MRVHFGSGSTKIVRLSLEVVMFTCTAPDLIALNIAKAAGRMLYKEDTTQDLDLLHDGERDLRNEKWRTICPVDLFLPLLSQVAFIIASASLGLFA